MTEPKRVTIYFEPELHQALRLKAAETDRSVSELVNEAVRELFAQDARDLELMRQRGSEPALAFESVLQELRRRGRV